MEYHTEVSADQCSQSALRCRTCSLYSSLSATLTWYLRRLQSDSNHLNISLISMWSTASVNMIGCEYRSRVFKIVEMILNEIQCDIHERHPEDRFSWLESCGVCLDWKTGACSSCMVDARSIAVKCAILDRAIRTHDIELVKILLNRAGIDAAIFNPTTDMNGLSLAMILDDTEIAETTIPHITDIKSPCCGAYTHRQLALRRRPAFVKMLLMMGADMQQFTSQGDQTENLDRLHSSSRSVVKWILEKGDPTLLHAAVDCGCVRVRERLNDTGDTILHMAVRTENVTICKSLLKYNVSIFRQNVDGETPLGLALTSPTGHEIARHLLQGQNLIFNTTQSYVSELGVTLPHLHIACYTGKIEMVKSLLGTKYYDNLDEMSICCERLDASGGQHGVQCTLCDQYSDDCITNTLNITPSYYLKPDVSNISLLTNINSCSDDGYSPAQIAVKGGQVSVLKYLLSAGADPRLTTKNGTLFHSAVRSQNMQTLKYVLGILPSHDLNCVDTTGSTPLHVASKGANPAICASLLENGASLNGQDKNGETALSVACFFGREENAQLLIQHGADITIEDGEGTPPAYWALMNDKVKISTYLLRAGLKLTTASFRRTYPRRMRIMENEAFRQTLDDHMTNIPSLMHLSRLTTRETLCKNAAGVTIKPLIDTLDIPVILKDFLLLRF